MICCFIMLLFFRYHCKLVLFIRDLDKITYSQYVSNHQITRFGLQSDMTRTILRYRPATLPSTHYGTFLSCYRRILARIIYALCGCHSSLILSTCPSHRMRFVLGDRYDICFFYVDAHAYNGCSTPHYHTRRPWIRILEYGYDYIAYFR